MPGIIAFAVGVVIAVGVFVPWAAWEYRRHGQLGFRHSIVAFGTLVYSLALVTYTLLPLPDDAATLCGNLISPQLAPFAFIGDVAKEGGVPESRALLSNPASTQVLFNVLLFVPLGALVRHAIARRRVLAGLAVGIGVGFVASLLIEITQLTGDWFLYPCPYRLFDVDDLLANTTGAAIGTLLAPLVGLLAGSDRTADADAPRPVTATRRFSGMLADILAIWLLSATLSIGTELVWATMGWKSHDHALGLLVTVGALVAPAAQLAIVLATGRTLGEHVVRLRPTPVPGAGKRVVRWALGSGGWAAILTISQPLPAFLAFTLAVTSIIAVWATRGRRGLALAMVRSDVEDDRTPHP